MSGDLISNNCLLFPHVGLPYAAVIGQFVA